MADDPEKPGLPAIIPKIAKLRGVARRTAAKGTPHDILPPQDRRPVWKGPSIGLALGGGGAKGIAHIPVLEALDDLGVRPAAVAGTSIGAIIGAMYAAGFSGREIRAHVLATFRRKAHVFNRLLEARAGNIVDLMAGFGNPVLIDGEKLLDAFWPKGMPDTFEGLAIPFTAVAGDVLGRAEVKARTGPLASAVAGSMALPGLVKAEEWQGHLLVDGYTVNPVPVDAVSSLADIVIAVDLGAAEGRMQAGAPGNVYEAFLQSVLLMQHTLTEEKFRHDPPAIRLIPAVGPFGVLDFFKAEAILAASEPMKDQLKRQLDRLLLTGH